MFFLSSNATVKNVKINYEGMVTLISFSANNPLRSYKHGDYRSLNLHKLPIKNYWLNFWRRKMKDDTQYKREKQPINSGLGSS